MGDRHHVSDSLPEEIADGATLGHQRYVRLLSLWQTVGTDSAGLTSTDLQQESRNMTDKPHFCISGSSFHILTTFLHLSFIHLSRL